MSTMQPILEPVEVVGHISGTDIIAEVCDLIGERLSRHDSLRATDAYKGYSLRATFELQLIDVDRTEVKVELAVGAIDPSQKVERITVGGTVSMAGADAPNLERPIDSAGAQEPAAPQGKRWYAPRNRPKPRF